MSTPRSWSITRCATWDEAWALGDAAGWLALSQDPAGHAFGHPALVRAWAETVGHADAVVPHVIVARHAQDTVVILPAVVRTYAGRRATRRVLEPAGGALFGYHTPLWSRHPTSDDATDFWQAVRRVAGTRVDQALFRFVSPAAAGHVGAEPAGDESPVLSLIGCPTFDDVLARMSRNAREQVRRITRRLADAGEIRLAIAAPSDGPQALQAFRTQMVPAYQARWRGHPNGCLLDAPGVTDFFARVVAVGVPERWAQFATLWVGDQPVAWHIGLAHASGWYWWLPAHAAEWEAAAPGRALLAALIARAVADRVPAMHLLTGAQRYKRSWHPTPGPMATVRWYAPGLRGAIAHVYDRWRAPASSGAVATNDDS